MTVTVALDVPTSTWWPVLDAFASAGDMLKLAPASFAVGANVTSPSGAPALTESVYDVVAAANAGLSVVASVPPSLSVNAMEARLASLDCCAIAAGGAASVPAAASARPISAKRARRGKPLSL